jgi:hypothetical protein
MVNAKDEIVAKHVNADGTIDWDGVTGENGAVTITGSTASATT